MTVLGPDKMRQAVYFSLKERAAFGQAATQVPHLMQSLSSITLSDLS